jgi:hypothetical protein
MLGARVEVGPERVGEVEEGALTAHFATPAGAHAGTRAVVHVLRALRDGLGPGPVRKRPNVRHTNTLQARRRRRVSLQ